MRSVFWVAAFAPLLAASCAAFGTGPADGGPAVDAPAADALGMDAPATDAPDRDAQGADSARQDLASADGGSDEDVPPAKVFDNPCITGVEAAFDAIGSGATLAVGAGDVNDTSSPIPWPLYTDTIENGLGINNHLQGAQRLHGTPYLIFTGGDVRNGIGHLFLVALGSKPVVGRWGSNLGAGGLPPGTDRVVGRIDLDSERWHAGGPSALGDLVAIPMESGGQSTILFYDLSEPEAPRRIDVAIERTDQPAAAVALARIEDDRILAAVRTDSIVDFYLSISSNIEDGFSPLAPRWDHSGGGGLFGGLSNAQNTSLIRQCNGELFYAGFYNTSPGIPAIPGENRGLLLHLSFPGGDLTQVPVVEERSTKTFTCDGACNFDAVAGLFALDAETLILYGARHYRERDGNTTRIQIREL